MEQSPALRHPVDSAVLAILEILVGLGNQVARNVPGILAYLETIVILEIQIVLETLDYLVAKEWGYSIRVHPGIRRHAIVVDRVEDIQNIHLVDSTHHSFFSYSCYHMQCFRHLTICWRLCDRLMERT